MKESTAFSQSPQPEQWKLEIGFDARREQLDRIVAAKYELTKSILSPVCYCNFAGSHQLMSLCRLGTQQCGFAQLKL